jgi:hypothetical protein
VSGRDRSWVAGTADLLSSELAKGVPKWAFIRHGLVAVALAVLLILGSGGLLVATVADDPGSWIGPLVVVGIFVALPCAGLTSHLIRKLFPGFEILQPGASNSGRRTIAGIVTLAGLAFSVVGVVLGVLALP